MRSVPFPSPHLKTFSHDLHLLSSQCCRPWTTSSQFHWNDITYHYLYYMNCKWIKIWQKKWNHLFVSQSFFVHVMLYLFSIALFFSSTTPYFRILYSLHLQKISMIFSCYCIIEPYIFIFIEFRTFFKSCEKSSTFHHGVVELFFLIFSFSQNHQYFQLFYKHSL